MKQMDILFFGQLTDLVGAGTIQIENPGTVDQLKKLLFEKYPAMTNTSFTIAINNKLAVADEEITDGATIACMPPFSGG